MKQLPLEEVSARYSLGSVREKAIFPKTEGEERSGRGKTINCLTTEEPYRDGGALPLLRL